VRNTSRRARSRPSAALIVAVAALLVAVGGSALAAVAAIPQDGRFTACYQTSGDILNRIVLFAEPNEACPATYARVTWSQGGGAQGPQGPPGPQGPQGPAGPAADSTSIRLAVTQRRITMRQDQDAVVRCPVGRAVGGGEVVHNGRQYVPIGSYPFVENTIPVGWAFRPQQQRRFTVDPGRLESTRLWTGLPRHRHTFYEPARMLPLEATTLERMPVEVTVYVVCIRDPVAVPLPPRP
jgi:hypothetical protein